MPSTAPNMGQPISFWFWKSSGGERQNRSPKGIRLPETMAVALAVVSDESTDVPLLRRPTPTNRAGVTVLLGQMRRMLEDVERDTWPRSSRA